MKPKVTSIKRELFQSSGYLILVMIACFGLIFAGVFHASEMAKARAILRHTNRSAQLFVTGAFREIINTLSVLENDPEIRNGAAPETEAWERVLAKYQAFANANEAIEFVYSGYADGSMIIDPDVWERPEGFDPTVRPWYVAAMQSAPEMVVGVPYREYTSREWMVSTSQALKLSDGRYGGVIAIDYAMVDIVAIFSQYTDYTTGRSFVIDNEGQIVLHRDDSLLGAPAAHILEAMAGAEQGPLTYRADDGTRLAHFSPVPLTGWTIITDVSRNEIVRPILMRILAAIGIAGIIAVALGLTQSLYLSRRLSRPLLALRKAIRAAISGTTDGLAKVAYPLDEIGVMAANIGILAQQAFDARTKALRASEDRFRCLVENSYDLIWTLTPDGVLSYVSPAWKRGLGYEPSDVEGTAFQPLVHPEDVARCEDYMKSVQAARTSLPGPSHRVRHADGTWRWHEARITPVFAEDGLIQSFVGVSRDIAEQKQRVTFSELSRDVLQVLNEPDDVQTTIRRVLASITSITAFDAVGIRLQHEADFPYVQQDGFSEDFLMTENSLIERDAQGEICRDAAGNPRLECTCGLVLSGKTDPSNPLFTPGGSAWTNDSFPILDVPADQDPRHHPRNQCIHQGYASIALIPIRAAARIVGLLQINDRRKNRFSLADIEQLEGVAAHIGSALQRKQIEQSLMESEARFKALFAESPVSILIHEKDTGEVVDANQAAWQAYGYTSLEALKAADFFSDTPYSVREALAWIHKAVTEGEQQFEWRSRKANGDLFWEQVFLRKVMLAQVERVLATTIDITQRKRTEDELHKNVNQLTRVNKLMMGREMRVLELKKEVNALRKQTGQEPSYTAVEKKK